jgi:hypothetical protein
VHVVGVDDASCVAKHFPLAVDEVLRQLVPRFRRHGRHGLRHERLLRDLAEHEGRHGLAHDGRAGPEHRHDAGPKPVRDPKLRRR